MSRESEKPQDRSRAGRWGDDRVSRETTEDKNSLLLGIKYEAAKLGGVEGVPLQAIEEQLENEVGEGWESDEEVAAGRDAVRREHGLPPLGETRGRPAPETSKRRSLWRRVLGR